MRGTDFALELKLAAVFVLAAAGLKFDSHSIPAFACCCSLGRGTDFKLEL